MPANLLRLTTGSAYRANADGSISHQHKPGARFKRFSDTPDAWALVVRCQQTQLASARRDMFAAVEDQMRAIQFVEALP